MLNRRIFFKALAILGLVSPATLVAKEKDSEDNPDNLPVVKYNKKREIANVEELIPNIPYVIEHIEKIKDDLGIRRDCDPRMMYHRSQRVWVDEKDAVGNYYGELTFCEIITIFVNGSHESLTYCVAMNWNSKTRLRQRYVSYDQKTVGNRIDEVRKHFEKWKNQNA